MERSARMNRPAIRLARGCDLSMGVARLLMAWVALFLAGAIHAAYVFWLVPVYGSMGFHYPPQSSVMICWSYLLAIIPVAWMPIQLRRPSQFLHWAIYVTTYVPVVLTLTFLRLRPDPELVRLQILLLIAFAILGCSYRLKAVRLVGRPLRPTTFWTVFGICAAALFIRVIVVYRNNFHFVSLENVYELRFSGGDLATEAGLAYPITWLGFAFIPVLMACGLWSRRRWLFVVGVMGSLLLYSTQGMKYLLFSGIYILAMYQLLRRRSDLFGLRFVSAAGLCLGVFILYVVGFDAAWSTPAIVVGANFVLRVFGNNGFLMAQYHSFFSDHPLTYYSYLTGVNKLLSYPYDLPLGMEVARARGLPPNDAGLYNNENAGFWATDGLAALGLPGVIVISIVMAIVFYCLDVVSSRHRVSLVALFLSQYVISMINISFFTSWLTGGLVWLFAILYFMPAIGSRGDQPVVRKVFPPLRNLDATASRIGLPEPVGSHLDF